MKALSIYIHIPFCKAKCFYCDFASYPQKDDLYEPYIKAVIKEINGVSKDYSDYIINTIFIGGGTPTVLPSYLLLEMLSELKKCFNISSNAEITIESNPKTIDYEKLCELRQAGINRLSIGVQAWQNRLLEKLGRIYKIEDFTENFEVARKAGFDNINLDLMFALPEQTLDDWIETLKNAIALKPEHISAYSLILEEGTPFYEMYEKGMLQRIDDETDRNMYYFAKNFLKENDYLHYEISNFAKACYESRHNLVYWRQEEYLGFGLGAHSYINKYRFHNSYDLNKYIHSSENKVAITEDVEHNTSADEYAEYMFLGLRLIKGISIQNFKLKFEKDIDEIYGKQLEKCIQDGLLTRDKEYIRLTDRGIDVSNIVFEMFIL